MELIDVQFWGDPLEDDNPWFMEPEEDEDPYFEEVPDEGYAVTSGGYTFSVRR